MAKSTSIPFFKWIRGLFSFLGKVKFSPKKISGKKFAIGGAVATCLILLLYLVFSLVYMGRIYPRVMVGPNNFGHLTKDQAKTKLEDLTKTNQDQSITLQFQDRSFQLKADDINFKPSVDQTATDLYQIGRDSVWYRAIFHQLQSIFYRHKQSIAADADLDAMSQKLDSITLDIDAPAVDASAKFDKNNIVTTAETTGKKVDRDPLEKEILRQFSQLDRKNIILETKVDEPKIVLPAKDALNAQVNELTKKSLVITWSGGQKKLSGTQMQQLIGFVAGEKLPQKTSLGNVQSYLKAAYAQEPVKLYISQLAKSIDLLPIEPKLTVNSGVLTVSTPSKPGKVVDQDTAAKAITDLLNNSQNASESYQLVMVDKQPVINENNFGQLGIKELIGSGSTTFTGSPPERVHNITTGMNILQSSLIPPGGEFSTVKTLGTVDESTGFVKGLVIKGNKSEPEYGGGLCQVSTTLFRAVLNTGLKVTERQNHAYRIGYYEPPVGLDATIYLPQPDFKFVNDTASYVLLQGRVQGYKLTFELWGTSDGRTSSIGQTKIFNITEPPSPVYSETDTLKPGEKTLFEHSHQGADTTVDYTVTRNGQVIDQTTFKSHYQPWPERWLVGPGFTPPPTGSPTPSPSP